MFTAKFKLLAPSLTLALCCAACSSDQGDTDTGLSAQTTGTESASSSAPSGSDTPGAQDTGPMGPANPLNPTSTNSMQPAPTGTPAIDASGGSGGTPEQDNVGGSNSGANGLGGERGSAGDGPTGFGGGGASGGSDNSGGTAAGGAPGNGGAATNGGAPSSDPEPSAMCGNANGSPAINLPDTIVTIPDSYDGSTPVPVVIAFHAAGNPNTQMQSIIGSTFDSEYILLYPKSAGNGWDNNADGSKVDAIFDALDANACYDQNRVFATGHSSGAQFIVQRLCAGEGRWRAVSPVASSVYCSSWDPIPALVIHGIGDVEREAYGLADGDGLKDIVPYRTSNRCQESFQTVPVEGCQSGGVDVDPGCRDFDGCTERTRWCQHNDPQYGTSHHGVPCFGARVMKEFFDMYR